MCKSIWYWEIYQPHTTWSSDLCPTSQTTYKDGWNMIIFIDTLRISALTWLKQSICGTVFFVGTFFFFYICETASCFILFDLGFILVFSYHCTPLCFLFGDGNVNFCEMNKDSIKSHLWSWVSPLPSCRPGTPWCSPRGALSNQTQISKETLTH